jgi:hypothetical protein
MSDKTVKLLVSFKVPGQFDVETTKLSLVNLLKRQILKFTEDVEITDADADACIKALLQTPEAKESPFSIVCDDMPDFPIVPVIITEDIAHDEDKFAGQLEYQVSDGLPGKRSGAFPEGHLDEAMSTCVEAQKKRDERLNKHRNKHSRNHELVEIMGVEDK